MRAWIWSPGTGPRIGSSPAVESCGLVGEILLRSVRGVQAPAGSGGTTGSVLSAGVVAALFVVKSALSKQVASARRVPRRASTSSHLVGADAPFAGTAVAPINAAT